MNATHRFFPAATSAMERACVPTTCDCCGKENLKKTVKVVSRETGRAMWMGTGCAAKACGKGIREFTAEQKGIQDAADKTEAEEEDRKRRADFAAFQALLDARTPAELRGNRYAQIQFLGGMVAARAMCA